MNQKLGTPLGFVNPLLYGKHAAGQLFRHHGGRQWRLHRQVAGWDACTGLGRIIGTRLLDSLAKP